MLDTGCSSKVRGTQGTAPFTTEDKSEFAVTRFSMVREHSSACYKSDIVRGGM